MAPVEREIKLRLDAAFRMPAPASLHTLSFVPLGTEALTAVYWDTPSLSVFSRGLGLRFRSSEKDQRDQGIWTFKGVAQAQGEAVVREELETTGNSAAPPAEIVRELPPGIAAEKLEPVVQMQTERRHYAVDERGEVLADMVWDTVTICDLQGRRLGRFQEIEIELVTGVSVESVSELVRKLIQAGAVADKTPKYHRALAAAGRIRGIS